MMRNLGRIVAVMVGILAGTGNGQCGSGPEPPTAIERNPPDLTRVPQARIGVLMAAISADRAPTVISRLRTNVHPTELNLDLLILVKRGEATFLDWPELTVHAGRAGTSESAREERYPSEFDPPNEPTLGYRKPTPLRSILLAVLAAGYGPSIGVETRNLGTQFEAWAERSSIGAEWRLRFFASRVSLESFDHFAALPGSREGGVIRQPRFTTHKVSTDLRLPAGEQRLVYAGRDPGQRDRFILFILGLQELP